jgi:hypothetical protein
MVKKVPGFVLASQALNVPRTVRLGLSLTAALLEIFLTAL